MNSKNKLDDRIPGTTLVHIYVGDDACIKIKCFNGRCETHWGDSSIIEVFIFAIAWLKRSMKLIISESIKNQMKRG